MAVFRYSRVDFALTCLGLLFLLLDVGLDVYAAASFYRDGARAHLAALLLFLLGSSALVQAYSWLWYAYERFRMETAAERRLTRGQLAALHALQLGIYVRHAGVLEMSVRSFFTRADDPGSFAVFLSHDLSMLRLIETFSESCPQLVLMLTIILQQGQLDPVTVLKAVGSASAVAFSVTMYHRCLRSFLPDKQNQSAFSSAVYFLWNLLLISSRLVALALFASVLPCFVFAHFFSSWLLLFFFAWRSGTAFMESPGGEWLYRATVGLIWYFDWFNVVEGRTRYRTLIYHGYVLADISLLCGLWSWKMIEEPPEFEISHLNAAAVAVGVVGVYIAGLFFKMVYYKFCHPNLSKEDLRGAPAETPPSDAADETDFAAPPPENLDAMTDDLGEFTCRRLLMDDTDDTDDMDRSFPAPPPPSAKRELKSVDVMDRSFPSPPPPPAPRAGRCNKRMRMLAQNFYS